jgi:hypothetical protein
VLSHRRILLELLVSTRETLGLIRKFRIPSIGPVGQRGRVDNPSRYTPAPSETAEKRGRHPTGCSPSSVHILDLGSQSPFSAASFGCGLDDPNAAN